MNDGVRCATVEVSRLHALQTQQSRTVGVEPIQHPHECRLVRQGPVQLGGLPLPTRAVNRHRHAVRPPGPLPAEDAGDPNPVRRSSQTIARRRMPGTRHRIDLADLFI